MKAGQELLKRERPFDEDELRGQARRDRWLHEWQEKVDYLVQLVTWDTMFMISNRVKVPRCETMEREFIRWMKSDFPGVPTFYAIGLHPGGHGAHCHGTMRLSSRHILRKTIWESAFERFGRSEFREPRCTMDVVGYVCKPAVGEALKHGHWGLIGVSLNSLKVQHVLRRQVKVQEPTSTVDVITVADVIEGNKGLPGPELDLVDRVNLWK
jgi:hypothetical protein